MPTPTLPFSVLAEMKESLESSSRAQASQPVPTAQVQRPAAREKKPSVVLIGSLGADGSAWAADFAAKLESPIVFLDDVLRPVREGVNTPASNEARLLLDEGAPLPSQLLASLVAASLPRPIPGNIDIAYNNIGVVVRTDARNTEVESRNFVLAGVVCAPDRATALDAKLKQLGRPIDFALVDERESASPLANYYRQKDRLITVDGSVDPFIARIDAVARFNKIE